MQRLRRSLGSGEIAFLSATRVMRAFGAVALSLMAITNAYNLARDNNKHNNKNNNNNNNKTLVSHDLTLTPTFRT